MGRECSQVEPTSERAPNPPTNERTGFPKRSVFGNISLSLPICLSLRSGSRVVPRAEKSMTRSTVNHRFSINEHLSLSLSLSLSPVLSLGNLFSLPEKEHFT